MTHTPGPSLLEACEAILDNNGLKCVCATMCADGLCYFCEELLPKLKAAIKLAKKEGE